MKLVRRNQSIPTFFEDFFTKDVFDSPSFREFTVPAANIHENDNNFELELAVPGMKKEDFEVKLEKNYLTISAESKEEKEEKKGKVTSREFNYKSFKRTFSIDGEKIDGDNIKAGYENGILQLEIPKKANPIVAKTIKVS